MFKRFIILALLLIAASPLCAQDKTPPPPKYRYPEFTVVGYADFPNEPEHQLALAKYTLSKGFTAVEATEDMLDVCRKAGLKVRVGSPSIPKLIAHAAKYKDDPAVFGYFVSDRRSRGAYPGWAQIERDLTAADPNHPAIFVNSAQMNMFGEMADIVKPRLLTYYHYHYSRVNHPERYYLYLQMFRDLGLKHGAQVMAMLGGHDPQVRRSMYVAVAHGVQGFSFFPPHFVGCAMDSDRNAVLDENGRPTFTIAEHAKAISNTALELKVLGPTLLKLTNDAVYHTEKDLLPGAGHAPADSWVQPEGEAFLVGVLHDEAKNRYLIPVNLSADKAGEMTMKLKDVAGVEMMDRKTGEWQPLPLENSEGCKVLKMTLAAQEGQLLKVR